MSRSAPKFALAAAAVTILAWGCTQTAQPAPPDSPSPTATTKSAPPDPLPVPNGDDRPPIIIGDGSIDLYIDPSVGTTGSWVDENGDGKTWGHHGDQNVSVQHFELMLLNTKDNGAGSCGTLRGPYLTEKVTIEYKDPGSAGNPKKKVIITHVNGNLQAVFEEKATKDADPDFSNWLSVDDPKIKLTSVAFRLPHAMSDTVCNFNPKHLRGITIHQSQAALPEDAKQMKKD